MNTKFVYNHGILPSLTTNDPRIRGDVEILKPPIKPINTDALKEVYVNVKRKILSDSTEVNPAKKKRLGAPTPKTGESSSSSNTNQEPSKRKAESQEVIEACQVPDLKESIVSTPRRHKRFQENLVMFKNLDRSEAVIPTTTSQITSLTSTGNNSGIIHGKNRRSTASKKRNIRDFFGKIEHDGNASNRALPLRPVPAPPTPQPSNHPPTKITRQKSLKLSLTKAHNHSPISSQPKIANYTLNHPQLSKQDDSHD